MKQTIFLFLVLILNACAALPTQVSTPTAGAPFVIKQEENQYAPRTKDINMKRDEIILTSSSLSERYDLTPLRAELHILGSMPNVCSELRIKVNSPNNEYKINIEVYGVSDPKPKCGNVFQQFDTTILLGVYSTGQYTVWVNGNLAGTLASY
jgi:hypothetical protein